MKTGGGGGILLIFDKSKLISFFNGLKKKFMTDRKKIKKILKNSLIVAKALDGQRYPLPLYGYLWV